LADTLWVIAVLACYVRRNPRSPFIILGLVCLKIGKGLIRPADYHNETKLDKIASVEKCSTALYILYSLSTP